MAGVYVVWKGRKPGIYKNWETCEVQIKGFENNQFKKFNSLVAAKVAFRIGYKATMKLRDVSLEKALENYDGKPLF